MDNCGIVWRLSMCIIGYYFLYIKHENIPILYREVNGSSYICSI